jgi:D-alanine-D-alanine ligase
VPLRVAVIYNDPVASRYQQLGENKAIRGVLDEVRAASKALIDIGHIIQQFPLRPPLTAVRDTIAAINCDLVFNIFEGFEGSPETEAKVALMLEELGKKHTGCPSEILAIGLDKARARVIMESQGVPTPAYQVLSAQTVQEFRMGYPCIVKPCAEDASHGITPESVVRDLASLVFQVRRICESYGGKAMVEDFLEGREFNATVFGNDVLTVLPPSEIVFSLPEGMPRVLTFGAKWEPKDPYFGGTKAVCPAPVTASLMEELKQTALAAFKAVKCRGYARVDMRLDAKGQPRVLELNPNPDITPGLGAARQARAAGIAYRQFIRRIVQLAMEVQR